MNPYDKYPPGKTFGSEVILDQYIQHVYFNYFRVSGMSPTQSYSLVGQYTDLTAYTEEKWGIQAKINSKSILETAKDCDSYFGPNLSSTVGNTPYTRIRSCNEILEGIDTYGQTLSPEFIKKAKGQVYFLRAIQLFDLVRVYGAVPIVNTVLNAADRDAAKAYGRESVEDCIKQIANDLTEASNLLPTRKQWGDSEYGRLTKEAALAYKSRVLLVFASPVFNADWNNSSNQRWADALDATVAAQTFLDSEGYGLYGSTGKEWDEMFYKNDNKFCKEVIMVKMLAASTSGSDERSNWQKAIRLKTMGSNGAGFQAPQGMLDIFPMADGKPAVDENGSPINSYDPFLFFKNRDPRFYYTFTFSGMKWGYDKNADAVVWNYYWEDASAKQYYAGGNGGSSPAIVRKMSSPLANSDNTYAADGTDVFEYRYAELLLNLAECYAATNKVSEAVTVLGKLRNRVGISAGSDNSYGLGTLSGKNEAIKACLRERQIELAYEGKRYWDIWRWMLYNDDASDNNTTCAALGLKPLNGTHRIGKYLKVQGVAAGSADPITADVASFTTPVDVTDEANLQANLDKLAAFWTAHFEFKDTKTPVDNISNEQAEIAWQEHYYLSGLPENVLLMNPWLLQSKGWQDAYSAAGTFDARR